MADQSYKTFTYVYQNKGVIAKYTVDVLPEGVYLDLTNFESRLEGSIVSRLGPRVINTNPAGNNLPLTDTSIHTLARLKSLNDNSGNAVVYRYAGAGANLYRRAGDTQGAYAGVNGATALSGSRFSTAVYRPDLNSLPYLFIADTLAMLKDNGTGNAQKWGILPPTIPASFSLSSPSRTDVELFEADAGFTFVNYTGDTLTNRVNTTLNVAINSTGVQYATPASMSDIIPGEIVTVDTAGQQEKVIVMAVTSTQFQANFTKTHAAGVAIVNKFITGNVASNTTATVSKVAAVDLSSVGGTAATDNDVIEFDIKISDPANIKEVKILFDVGDGSFTQDYYVKSISPASFQVLVSGTETAADQIPKRLFRRSSGASDFRSVGENIVELLPGDDPTLFPIRPEELETGLNRWTAVQTKRGEFLPVGHAGDPGKNWANVNAFRIQIVTNTTGAADVGLDNIYLYGGNGPDSFAASPYDYLVTYYNVNTGCESNPSPVRISTYWVSPRRNPVVVSWSASADTQVTHVRVYRRGGTLTDTWRRIAQVAVGTTSFTDTLADNNINLFPTIELDNDSPVTSLLRAPVNTTLGTVVTAGSSQTVTPSSMVGIAANQLLIIGTGSTQETIVVQSITATQFTAFFQYAHGNTETVYGSTVAGRNLNLCANAFERMFLAGDPDNPHFLYYSKVFRPESFPPQNYVEIGSPKDPIMAVVELRGLLYVMTLTRIYLVQAPAGSIPVAFPTGSKHGLYSKFAWAISDNEILYLGYDGVYAFRSGRSQLISLDVDWVFNGLNLGPIVAMDTTQRAQTVIMYGGHELYVSYIDTSGTRRRIIYHDIYNRWRPDDRQATAMLFEEDTANYLFAQNDGLVYQDRINNYDSGGYTGGVETKNAINYVVQSPQFDQGSPKAFKNYTEFTLDFDSGGQDVNVYLLLDSGQTVKSLGIINSKGRAQVQVTINGGAGFSSQNAGIKLTGAALTAPVYVYKAHLRAIIQAEFRTSYDSYWMNFGTEEYKLVKEGWFEYTSTDTGGINFQVFLDGSTTPTFTFNLPQSSNRVVARVRFPAHKAKLWRFVATSAGNFQLYDSSFVMVKGINSGIGYNKAPVAA